MPSIRGKHDGSQILLNVAIFDVDILDRAKNTDSFGVNVFTALVDTGAQRTCITERAARAVGLSPIGKVPIRGVSGLNYHNNYLFRVGFAFSSAEEQSTAQLSRVHLVDQVIEGAELSLGNSRFDVLLGMDVISIGTLTISRDKTFIFAFG